MILSNCPHASLSRWVRICSSSNPQLRTHIAEPASSRRRGHFLYVLRCPNARSPVGEVEIDHLSSEHGLSEYLPILDPTPHSRYPLGVPEDVYLVDYSISRNRGVLHSIVILPSAILTPLECLVSRVCDRALFVVEFDNLSSRVLVVDEWSDHFVGRLNRRVRQYCLQIGDRVGKICLFS